MRRAGYGLAAVVMVACAVAAPSAHAAPSGHVATRVLAFSDATPYSPHDPATVAAIRSRCVHRPQRLQESFSGAIGAAQLTLARHASKRALRGMARSREIRNPRSARRLAAAALVENRPYAALAALLDAQARRSGDPVLLLDLSAVLSRVGLPREALAVLSHAHSLRRPGSPMGVSQQAILANNRGLALLSLGHDSAARRQFAAAERQAPLLSEARMNLAAASICAGGAAVVAAPWRDPPIEPPIKDPLGREQQQPGSVLDLSQGVAGDFTRITYPTAPEQGAGDAAAFAQLQTDAFNAYNGDGQQAVAALGREDASRPSGLTLSRTSELMSLLDRSTFLTDEPQLETLEQAAENLSAAPTNVSAEFDNDLIKDADSCDGAQDVQTCMDLACSRDMASRHGEWLTEMDALDSAYRSYYSAVYRYMTGVAANLANPDAHQAALLYARGEGEYDLSLVAGAADDWLQKEAAHPECFGNIAPTTISGAAQQPSSTACGPEVQAVRFTLDLGVIALSVNCEEVRAQISTGPEGLFAQVGHDFAHGSTTVFAGAQAGLKVPGVGGPGVQAGAYVTIGDDGQISDGGLRATAGYTGPIGVGATGNISFAGAFQ